MKNLKSGICRLLRFCDFKVTVFSTFGAVELGYVFASRSIRTPPCIEHLFAFDSVDGREMETVWHPRKDINHGQVLTIFSENVT